MSKTALAHIEKWLTTIWYRKQAVPLWAATFLKPLRWLYQAIRLLSNQEKKCRHSKQPLMHKPYVLVIGNVVAGGTGKTPIVMAVCQHLQTKGVRVGILSRGYGRHNTEIAVFHAQQQKINSLESGDEPAFLAQQTQCPVAVGQDRLQALEALIQHTPTLDLIVSDDGLQHHRLPRHFEWVVFDDRAAGNGQLLPEGPLREPLLRIQHVDAVIANNISIEQLACQLNTPAEPHWHPICINLSGFRRVSDGHHLTIEQAKAHWANQEIASFAGLGNPEKLFQALRKNGFHCTQTIGLPDHFNYPPHYEMQFSEDILITTGKDAVKLDVSNSKLWIAEIQVHLPTALTHSLENSLGLTTD